MKLNVGTCPSLETIGAFVDGRLMDRERERIADHLASCETCYFVFSETARSIATQAGRKIEPPPMAWWKYAAAGLAAAATLVFAVNLWVPFGANGDERALTQLVAAVGSERTFDSRLTGGFAYAPVRGAVRGSTDAVKLSPDVRIAIAEIEKQYAAKPVAAAAALVAGDPNRAIDILEANAQLRPTDPKILSDLAAAYLARAARTPSTDDASRALAAANRALEIDRLMPEALFNRALALQAAGMADARIAWQAYLTIDDHSGWADEARARLRILSNQP
jgi:tetratricopeptide (TPR) repeat protein